MNDSKMYAFPTYSERHVQEGLTKREYFAAMAMQGLITHYGCNDLTNLEERSIECADALLYGLDKTK